MPKPKKAKAPYLKEHENGVHYIYFHDGVRQQRESTKTTDATAALKLLLKFIEEGGATKNRRKLSTDRLTIGDGEDLYLEGQPWKRRKDVNTIFPLFAHLELLDLKTPGKVLDVFKALCYGTDPRKLPGGRVAMGIGSDTANRIIDYLRRICRWLEENEDGNGKPYLPTDTHRRFKRLKDKAVKRVNKATEWAPNTDDFLKVLAHAKTLTVRGRDTDPNRQTLAFRLITMLSLGGGQRQERVTRVPLANFHTDRADPYMNFADIPGIRYSEEKKGNPRIALLTREDLPDDLNLLKIIRRAKAEKVNDYYLDGITTDTVSHIMSRLFLEALGIDFGGTHVIRKMVATFLYRRGKKHLIPRLLGISIAMAEKHYIKKLEGEDLEAQNELADALIEAMGPNVVVLKKKA